MDSEIKSYRYKFIYDDNIVYIVHRGSDDNAHKKLKILLYKMDKIVLPTNSYMVKTCKVSHI